MHGRMLRTFQAMPFSAERVSSAPHSPGVYFLSRRHRLIFIGLAPPGTTVRAALLAHLWGEACACTREATEFEYDCSPNSAALHRYYMDSYRLRTGGLVPQCNTEEGVEDRRPARGGSRDADPAARQGGEPSRVASDRIAGRKLRFP
jgi:hypothetical protein